MEAPHSEAVTKLPQHPSTPCKWKIPHSEATTSLLTPFVWTYNKWTRTHIYIRRRNFSHSRDSSNVGCPHTEDNLAAGLAHWRYTIVTLDKGPYPEDASNLSMGWSLLWVRAPMQVSIRMRPHVFRYITIVSLTRLSPQRTNPVWTYSNYSPEESGDRYDVLNSSMLETYAASLIFIYVSSYACVHIIITAIPIPWSTCPEMD